MIHYNLHADVEAFTTERGDDVRQSIIMSNRQVHSTRVTKVPCEPSALDNVDALITDTPGLRIGVRTADCVPILLYDTVHRAVAAVHSGWKGTAANIIGAVLRQMYANYGTCCGDVCAVIGPCIHVEAFEVGEDVYDQFASAGYGAFACRLTSPLGVTKWHIDLPGICAHQLRNVGVEAIEIRPECTYALHERLYSYRHDGAAIGDKRMYSCIMINR